MPKKGEATQFKPGHTFGKGRPKGSRNKLSESFISDLVNEWREHGAEVLRIVRMEEPATLLKVVASVIPKEIEITPNALAELTDEQLELIASLLGRGATDIASDSGREGETIN